MTNLEYLDKFLSKNYGTICFHNQAEDGYVSFRDGIRTMETLSVYFANEIDVYNSLAKERLERAFGENFYKRYIGANNLKLGPLGGSFLATRYELHGKTLGIFYRYPTFALWGGVWEIIKYFIGCPIDGERLVYPKPHLPVPSNTGFTLKEGDEVKKVLEDYLKENNLPLVTRENGFYVAPSLPDIPVEIFGEQLLRANRLFEERSEAFKQSLSHMTHSDWDAYKKATGISEQAERADTIRKSDIWND